MVYWEQKDKTGRTHEVRLKIVKKKEIFACIEKLKRCNFCLEEKLNIVAFPNKSHLLNKNTSGL